MRLRTNRLLRLTVLTGLMTTATMAHADVYGYLDAEGTAHFATTRLDERYQLFVKGEQQFDSAQFMAPSARTAIVAQNRSPLFRYLVQHPNLKKYENLLDQAAREFSVEPALLKAVMAAESGFNPTAVSPKGAIGLMQVMPSTAERYGLAADAKKSLNQKLTDPKTNIRLGARYLRDLRQLFPNQPDLVIASYNAGEHAVQRYRNTVPPYPETRNYVQLVSQFYQVYRPPLAAVSTGQAGSSSQGRRVQMTIPGRASMPASVTGAIPAADIVGDPAGNASGGSGGSGASGAASQADVSLFAGAAHGGAGK